MKCPRCQMELFPFPISSIDSETFICFTADCAISQYTQSKFCNDHTYTITFDKWPHLRVETGRKNKQEFLTIFENETEKIIVNLRECQIHLTEERMQLILTFS